MIVAQVTTLFVELDPDDQLVVHGPAVIERVYKSGRQVRLRVQAAPDVKVERLRPHQRDGFVPRLPK